MGNGGGDIAVLTAQQDDLSGNVVALNDVQNAAVSTAPAAVATSDWWGSLHGPSTTANPGGAGGTVSGAVNFSPWIGTYTSSGSPGFFPTINAVYAVPTQLVLITEPSSSAGFGAQLAQQPVVEAEDASGNLGINFDSTSVPGSKVNLALNVTSGVGTLAGTFPINAVGGFATFTNLSITHHGLYTITANPLPTGDPWSSLIAPSAPSTTITVNPAASPPTVTVTDASATYNRLPFAASATITPNDGSPFTKLQGQGINLVYYVGMGTSGTNLGSTAPTNVGTYTVVATFPGSTDYSTASNSTSFTISPVSLTITAVASTRTYNGTTTATAAPAITSGALASGDTAGFIETYSSRNVGSGLTLTPSGVVNDGNSGKNYTYSYVTASSGVITAAPLTLTAAASSKTYDGTTAATTAPTITSGSVMPGDAAGFIETYASKNVGTGLTLSPSGVVNDGNSGKNYTYTYVATSSGVIAARALTVTAVTYSKTYDFTTAAAVIPTISAGSIAPGDTASFVEIFDTPNVGTGLTLSPSGSVSDGNSGNNYTYTFVPVSTGVITAASSDAWPSYALNPQHTATSLVASQPLDSILWQTPVDLQPQYSNGELAIHYGSPILTAANTVIIPVKTGTTSGFEIQARSGSSGALQWTLTSDYALEPSSGTNGYDWIPSYSPTLTPQNGLYYPADGGTVMYVASPDAAGPSPPATSRLAFYGLSSYNANSSAYNSNIFINTPITSDSSGDIFFGFIALAGNGLGLTTGVARIGANGVGTWVPVVSGMSQVATNSAPALSNDGSTLYVLESTGNWGWGKLVALNSQTLAVTAQVTLKDPNTGNDASIVNDATASPMVGPDGDVYIGVLESSFASNNDRGWLLHFSANLSQTKTPGAFGWDDTPSVVPASMVPSYHGTSTYLLMVKYNNYAGLGTGNGLNQIAILDPNSTESDPVTGTTVMDPVLSILGQTPDPEYDQNYPGAVREWCINSAAVDPATDSILAGSEDGKLYRWNLSTNTFTQVTTLTTGLGEAYTPTLIGPDGMVYAINNATLFAVGDSAAASFKFTAYPSPDTAGTANNFTVTVYNAEGDVDTAYTGTVHFTSSDQQAGLPADYTFTTGTGGDNGVHTFSATLKTAGTQYLKVTDTTTSSITGTDTGIVVQPAGAVSLTVAGFPTPDTAGVAGNFTVTAYDPYGNIATGYTGTVAFASGDSQAGLPASYTFTTGTGNDNGVHTFSATLKTAGTQYVKATDTTTSSIAGSETGIVVQPAGAASLAVTGLPGSVTSGLASNFTVTAYDPYGNIATGYTGKVHFTSSDSSAVLPANYTFNSGNAGTQSFTATLNSTGTQTIFATDTVTSSITGSESLTVNPIIASASFVKSDTTTQGNWIGVYGSDGYDLVASSVVNPAHATITPAGEQEYTWSTPSLTTKQALEVPPSGASRVAAVWYSATSFTVDVNVAGGQEYNLGLYFLDYDASHRAETVTLSDAKSNAVLNTQSVSNFTSGEYLVWTISGNVLITITRTAGANAVLSGLFFDPATATSPPTVSVTDASGTYDGLPFAASATITPNDGPPYDTLQGEGINFDYYAGTGTGGTNLGSTAPRNEGTYTVVATFPGSTNYPTASSSTSFTISPESLTITAAANTKTYSGTTAAATVPTITAGTVMPGDTAGFTDAYSSKNVGSSLTLTPSGVVNDGNSGKNYTYSYVAASSGTITAEALTVTAAANSKTYDGTTSATTVPTITSGTVMPGDTAGFIETYSTRNVGSGLTLTPGGAVNDGNSGKNYTYSYVAASLGTITARALTVTAVTNTKTYDGTTSAAAIPTITSGSIAPGDSANFIETYNTPNVGTGLTLTPSGTVTDGNSGNNYTYTFVPVSTGVITSASGATAVFVKSDTSTEGNWINVYGSDGYSLVASSVKDPAYATITPAGEQEYTWSTPSPATQQALEVPPSGTSRVAAVWYSATSFTVDVNVATGQEYNLELYLLDYDASGRAETVTLSDANTSAVLNTQSASNFASGEYLTWTISGNVLITITRTAGANAVLNGLFFDPTTPVPPPPPPPPPPPGSATASFVGSDTSTKGNWINVYGSDGYSLVASSVKDPAYATIAPAGEQEYTWSTPSPSTQQALEVPPSGTSRVAAVWYSATSFTVDVNVASGQAYNLELYFLDYDASHRAETVTLSDANTSAVLNTQSVSNFASGEYLTWTISGNVLITFTRTAGPNAVVSGLFFDPDPPSGSETLSALAATSSFQGQGHGSSSSSPGRAATAQSDVSAASVHPSSSLASSLAAIDEAILGGWRSSASKGAPTVRSGGVVVSIVPPTADVSDLRDQLIDNLALAQVTGKPKAWQSLFG